MRAAFENFPELAIHEKKTLESTVSTKTIQQKLFCVLKNVNGKTFTFEEIGNPVIPGCTLIFELGIADTKNFNFIDEEEIRKILAVLRKETFEILDFFCVIRYYVDYSSLKKPLKFDYYLIRFNFINKNMIELQIYHERGPQYIPPKGLVTFLMDMVNGTSPRTVLKVAKDL